MTVFEEFYDSTLRAFQEGDFIKLTISNLRSASLAQFKKLVFKPISMGEKPTLKMEGLTKTQSYTEILSIEEFQYKFNEKYVEAYRQMLLQTMDHDITLLISKKGKGKIIRKAKPTRNITINKAHDRQKHYLISPEIPFLQDLGIVSAGNNPFQKGKKKFKQINKFLEIINKVIPQKEQLEVWDMGSGKGYLSFCTYHHLSNNLDKEVTLTGVEIRDELVNLCNDIVEKHDLKGLHFLQGNIEELTINNCDILIALHACDTATDMAIRMGIDCKASSIIVAPCCQRELRKQIHAENVLQEMLQYGIIKERMTALITDTLRTLILQYYGYETNIIEFISSEHTAKNLMIVAKKISDKPLITLKEIELFKAKFGIKKNHLERMLAH